MHLGSRSLGPALVSWYFQTLVTLTIILQLAVTQQRAVTSHSKYARYVLYPRHIKVGGELLARSILFDTHQLRL